MNRVRRTFGLQPQRSETIKLFTDLLFVGKVSHVAGMNQIPRYNVTVLRVNEKRQTQPCIAVSRFCSGPGVAERRAHHHGATRLFAALDVAIGRVMGQPALASP